MTDAHEPLLDATAFGEGQLRFDTAVGHPLPQADSLSVTVAGAEGNVMGLLAQLGNDTGLITALPSNPMGRKVAAEYHAAGIDTSALIWRDRGRVALYFVERSSPPVPDRVVYDREGSCFWHLTVDDVDWKYLTGSRLVHLTGITACLNENLHEILLEAVAAAKHTGQEVSVDVNYRSQLAAPEVARGRLAPLLQAADVISCSRRDAATVFGIHGGTADVARALADRYGASAVLVSDGAAPAVALAGGEAYSVHPPVTTVVDRVGAGDALIGGFLHGYLRADPQLGLELGVAAAALTLTRYGDQVRTSLGELRELASAFGKDIVR